MGTNAQQFCLKWNNHQANMLSVFDRLLSNKSLVDVTIGCEGRQVKAHKVVLSACSPFFENLFTENPCKHPIVILKDIRYADLKALVEFMYKGEVNVVQEQLPTLLKTAEALKIKGLAEVTGEGKSEDKPHASVTPRPESPGSRRKRQRVRRKSTDSVGGHSDSEESVPKASRTEHDDSSMDGATSLDDGSQASLQHSQTPSQASGQAREKEPSNVQSNAVTVNNSSSSTPANNANSTTNGPNSSSKDADFEPTRLLEASMTTDHGTDNSTDLNNSTGPDNPLIPDGLDIKPIITLEEGATPTGAIVPASAAPSLPTGTDAISSLFPQGTGATALPGTSYQASPQSHEQPEVEANRTNRPGRHEVILRPPVDVEGDETTTDLPSQPTSFCFSDLSLPHCSSLTAEDSATQYCVASVTPLAAVQEGQIARTVGKRKRQKADTNSENIDERGGGYSPTKPQRSRPTPRKSTRRLAQALNETNNNPSPDAGPGGKVLGVAQANSLASVDNCSSGIFNSLIHCRKTSNGGFECVLCSKVKMYYSSAKQHYFTVHLATRPYRCKDCERSFCNRDGLEAHVRREHMGEYGYWCPQCGSGFFGRTALTNHKLYRCNGYRQLRQQSASAGKGKPKSRSTN